MGVMALIGALIGALLLSLTMSHPTHAGSTVVGGKRLSCSAARVVKTNRSPVAGFTVPGLIVLSPRRLRRYPRVMRRLIFLHECGHQYVGADETAADCWAVRRAKRQGWLTRRSFNIACRSVRKLPGSDVHLPGPARCRAMRRCFAAAPGPRRKATRKRSRRAAGWRRSRRR